jgi:ADP-ribosylglycohydrolase
MEKIMLDRNVYKDKVRGCWLGKNIGGTLGGPWEGHRHTHAFTFYNPVPKEAAPNDDLDLQLVWLKMLEEEGTDPSIRTFAQYWNTYARRYPWNEYGFFSCNFERGLRPPIAGCFENYFVDEMGSPIRSEIWACLHPADPQAAARMAWKDSSLDHTGGEGTYGEMFWAAVQSAAFVESDPKSLIHIGLNMIPLSSHIARSIREAVWCYENGKPWGVAREKIASRFGHIQPCNAVPNHGFTIIGWLYGKDFGDRLCKAVNCGYDTDCTGATLGALLGILDGAGKIPQKWIEPVGEKIILHKFTGACNPPATIDELTERTIQLAEQSVKLKDDISFGEAAKLPGDLHSRLFCNRLAIEARKQDNHAGVELLHGKEVWLHYGGEPVLRPGVAREIEVTVENETAVELDVSAPKEWQCTKMAPSRFLLFSKDAVPDRNIITVSVNGAKVEFTILGPGEAKGFEAGANVAGCPRCGARVSECMCEK